MSPAQTGKEIDREEKRKRKKLSLVESAIIFHCAVHTPPYNFDLEEPYL